MERTTALLLGTLLLASSCGPAQKKTAKPKVTPGLCTFKKQPPPEDAASKKKKKKAKAGPTMGVRELKPEEWFTLLLRNYSEGGAAGDEDCTGQPIAWQEPAGCGAAPATPNPVGGGALTEDDLTVNRHKGDLRLVWVITRRFDNGEGEGPVALADFAPGSVEIRAIGTLRGLAKRPRLRMERVEGTDLLVADGEVCADDNNPASCKRTTRILVRRGDRFAPEPIKLGNGECVGPAVFPLARDETVNLKSGWNRRFDLNTTLTFEKAGIKVHEQVVVHDSDPAQPADPPRLFRRADADRFIRVTADHLQVGTTSLWGRMLDAWASTEAPSPEGKQQ